MPAYGLQTVLELRERAEEAAKRKLARALQALTAAQKVQAEMEADLAQRKSERAQKINEYLQRVVAKGTAANGILGVNRYEARLRDEEAQLALDIEKQKEVVADRQSEADQKRADLAEAAKDKKVVDKHKEKWQKGVRAAREAREEQNQDEIGSALFQARKRDAARRGGT